MTVGGHPAGCFYLAIAPDNGPKWVLGQGFFQITPDTYALLEIAINNRQDYEAVGPVFEALLRSIRLEDPRQLEAERKVMLERGAAFLKKLDPQALRGALVYRNHGLSWGPACDFWFNPTAVDPGGHTFKPVLSLNVAYDVRF